LDATSTTIFRDQLTARRDRLAQAPDPALRSEVARLLREVDAALDRMERGTYGLCEVCHDPIEVDRLLSDPLVSVCLDHLSSGEQRALERDLELASRIQQGLLPRPELRIPGWDLAYFYAPRQIVSGDYCDLITTGRGDFYFMVGDISGKGVAASMLMAHLQAVLRTLVSLELPIGEMMERASRLFCESTLPTHYATLVCGKALTTGEVEIGNAGHPPPLLFHRGEVSQIPATGLPIGVFSNERFTTTARRLGHEDTILLYSDGVSEARDRADEEYGTDRLAAVLMRYSTEAPREIIDRCRRSVEDFRAGTPLADDVTLMAVRRTSQ
jgi:sigma-B regulation protein RsbU (phosphoserine phosphatase)